MVSVDGVSEADIEQYLKNGLNALYSDTHTYIKVSYVVTIYFTHMNMLMHKNDKMD